MKQYEGWFELVVMVSAKNTKEAILESIKAFKDRINEMSDFEILQEMTNLNYLDTTPVKDYDEKKKEVLFNEMGAEE